MIDFLLAGEVWTQRGVKRPIDGDRDGQAVCDIGAYEYQIPLFLPVILQN